MQHSILLTPLLSRKAAEKMNLITVNYDTFGSASGVVEDKREIIQYFAVVLSEDIDTLTGSVQLSLKPNAEPIRCPLKISPRTTG